MVYYCHQYCTSMYKDTHITKYEGLKIITHPFIKHCPFVINQYKNLYPLIDKNNLVISKQNITVQIQKNGDISEVTW